MESIAVSAADVELGLEICDSGRPLLVDNASAAEEVGVTSTEGSPAGVETLGRLTKAHLVNNFLTRY